MEKVHILTDSGSDILPPCPENLTVLPMTIRFGEREYRDGVDLDHREFYEKLLESDALPVTSLVSPGDFGEFYRQAEKQGETVVVVTLSSKLSGTWQSAVLAARDYPGRVFVVDSRNATLGERLLVEYALRLAGEGLPAKKIAGELERVRNRIRVIGLLDTLEYLKKGGRISKTVAFFGEAMAIKPVVTVRDGEVVMLGKARGSRNGNNFLIQEIGKAGGVDFRMPYALGYTGLSDAMLQKYIRDSEPLWRDHAEALPVHTIGATIGTHIGPGAIAVAFFDRSASPE